MIFEAARKIRRRIAQRLRGDAFDELVYWQDRAARLGARAVVNIGHTENEVQSVTDRQTAILFPLLREQLSGHESLVVDFGCGPGRFTPELHRTTGARVIGVDPIPKLLDMAPRCSGVEYCILRCGRAPLPAHSADAIFICLVLGGIVEAHRLRHTVREIERLLRPGGLLFLVENTSSRPNAPHWHFRSIDEYRLMFSFANLAHLANYDDCGETISVLAGRAAAPSLP